MPKCPKCNAPGERHPYIATVERKDGTLGRDFGTALCHTCGGTNEVSEEFVEAMRRGEILRQRRFVLNLSGREAAKLIGCSPVALSHIELGRITDENRELAERLWAELEENDAQA